MDIPPFETRPFAAYHHSLGMNLRRTYSNDLALSSASQAAVSADGFGAPLTKIWTKGPDGTLVKLSPAATRASQGSLVSRVVKRALSGILSVFRRKSSGGSSRHTSGGVTRTSSSEMDVDVVRKLEAWEWPGAEGSGVSPSLVRESKSVKTYESGDVVFDEVESYIDRRQFLELGLDYEFMERTGRIVRT